MSGNVTTLYQNFMSLFAAQKPKDYRPWQEERDVGQLKKKAQQYEESVTELKESGAVLREAKADKLRKESIPELAEVRQKTDQLQVTVSQMLGRWQEMPASEVVKSLDATENEIELVKQATEGLWGGVTDESSRTEAEYVQLSDVRTDLAELQNVVERERKELENRKNLKIGDGSGLQNWGLKQGWVPGKEGGEGTFKYESKEEWKNLQERGVDQKFDRLEEMEKIFEIPGKPYGKVHVRNKNAVKTATKRLEIERATAVTLRNEMTDRYKKRLQGSEDLQKEVANNIDFAKKLSSMLADDDIDPKLLTKDGSGGMLNRLMGDIVGQGQFEPGTLPKAIATTFEEVSVDDLKDGEANRVQQFISGFVDGLTEVNEPDKKTAEEQFETIWAKMEKTFNLQPEDKARLMERVDVYKKLAGGLADTGGSGKALRKDYTRKGKMTLNDNNTIEDPEAIIANDISGSMHSQFLAMEIAETLSGEAKDDLGQTIKGFKSAGASVQVKNKGILNARMLDALSLTAGGKSVSMGGDFVMHTAYEMINGVQAITGLANKVTQETATAVMTSLGKGKDFSDALEEALPHEVFPWQLDNPATVNGRATGAFEAARSSSTETQDKLSPAIAKLAGDVLWMTSGADDPTEAEVLQLRSKLEATSSFTDAMQAQFPREVFPWMPKKETK